MIDSVLETAEQFAARRVYLEAARMRLAEQRPAQEDLVRTAALHYRMERQAAAKAALEYECRPGASVLILRDGDAVPPELNRLVQGLPVHPKPLGIIQASAQNPPLI